MEAPQEGPLHRAWETLKEALAPLREVELVAAERLLDVDFERRMTRSRVRVLQGSSDHFPLREVDVLGKLAVRWCYLLRPGAAPLCLSPVVGRDFSARLGRYEVFLARRLELAPVGSVELQAVASGSEIRLEGLR